MLSVTCPPDCDADLLADDLIALGGRGAEERDGVLTTYLPPPEDPHTFARRAADRLGARTGRDDLIVTWRWQAQEDWSELWKRGLDARRVSERIVVHPSWVEPEVREGDIVIRLDPGMAFGTAEHGTTRGCLRLLDSAVTSGDRVLDVGTGSGLLAVAAAALGAASVRAVDLDPFAVEAARENAATNGFTGRVAVERARVTAGWLAGAAPFDGVLANLETHLLLPLLGGLARVTRPGGWMILSGILADERWSILDRLRVNPEAALRLEAEDRDGAWWSGRFRRRAGDARTAGLPAPPGGGD